MEESCVALSVGFVPKQFHLSEMAKWYADVWILVPVMLLLETDYEYESMKEWEMWQGRNNWEKMCTAVNNSVEYN